MKEYVEMGLLLDAISVSKLDYLAVADVVCKVPTADVQPVVRGEWIDSKDGTYYANCSVCEYQMDVHTERGYHNYCPNCGARMVEE